MSLVWLPCCHCGVSLEARGISDGCVVLPVPRARARVTLVPGHGQVGADLRMRAERLLNICVSR